MFNRENKEALLHYTISFIGGYMGVYPVIYIAKAFCLRTDCQSDILTYISGKW